MTSAHADDDPQPPQPGAPLEPGLLLDLQIASSDPDLPAGADCERWAAAALTAGRAADHCPPPVPGAPLAELTIRFVDEAEGAALNQQFRGRPGPTNVLSFPFEPPPGLPLAAASGLLGDLVLCAPVIRREAAEQGKPPTAHYAHLIVHGVFHLLGHDHEESAAAERMETLETAVIVRLGFPPPYEPPATTHDR